MDTSPDMSGRDVKPRIVKSYDGSDIVLNEELGIKNGESMIFACLQGEKSARI